MERKAEVHIAIKGPYCNFILEGVQMVCKFTLILYLIFFSKYPCLLQYFFYTLLACTINKYLYMKRLDKTLLNTTFFFLSFCFFFALFSSYFYLTLLLAADGCKRNTMSDVGGDRDTM